MIFSQHFNRVTTLGLQLSIATKHLTNAGSREVAFLHEIYSGTAHYASKALATFRQISSSIYYSVIPKTYVRYVRRVIATPASHLYTPETSKFRHQLRHRGCVTVSAVILVIFYTAFLIYE